MNEHYQRCRGRVSDYADGIIARIKSGKVNASAFEGLILSFLDQAAYRAHHAALHDFALTRLDGRSRDNG
ncbi:hypothetical protein [Bosea sp. BIWAKO-01]|uniref:hypothetical protein n=1 Tax=Bosea sp. BIWAKO-01 TaxID=506668 RepID=UPI000853C48A|nr:hypothetical protein [Bosea sp. BIWAKO-01]